MAIAETAAERIEMARVVKRTFRAVEKNFVAFVVVSTPWGAIHAIEDQFVPPDVFSMIFGSVVFSPLSLPSVALLQGGVIHGVVASLNGKRASVGGCLGTGLQYLWPMSLVGLLGTVAVMAGLVLLIVPGVILTVMWVAAGAACVVEGTGVSGAFRRSVELTRGYRWPIFGLFVALILFMFAFIFIVFLLVSLVAFSSNAAAALGTMVAQFVAVTISTMLFWTISSALGAAIYFELRQIKEGVGPEALASVFD